MAIYEFLSICMCIYSSWKVKLYIAKCEYSAWAFEELTERKEKYANLENSSRVFRTGQGNKTRVARNCKTKE